MTTPSLGPRPGPAFAGRVEQRAPYALAHQLAEHPLLSLEAIAELAQELPEGMVASERATKPIVTSLDESLVALDREVIADRIRDLASHDAWFNLLHLQQVPRYRELVDGIVDELARSSGLPPTALLRRTGFVFASSPGAVTAAHFDIENSLCLQLRGQRVLSIGSFTDAVQREAEVRRYWEGVYGRLDFLPQEIESFPLAPGTGAYIPPWTPHWITNGEESSLSLTVTFFTRSTEDESLAQAFNHRVRARGVDAAPYGRHPGRDRAKVRLMRGYGAAKRHLRPEGAPDS